MSLDAYRTKLPGHYRLKGNASSSLDNISQRRSSHDQSEEDPIELNEQPSTERAREYIRVRSPDDILGDEHPTLFRVPTDRPGPASQNIDTFDHAIILLHDVAPDGSKRCGPPTLTINRKALCDSLRKIIVNTYEKNSANLEGFPMTFTGPFRELFFHRKRIEELAANAADIEVRKDAKSLLDQLYGERAMGRTIKKYNRYMKDKEGWIDKDILWTAYPPNSLVVFDYEGFKECWICRGIDLSPDMAELHGLRLDFDGDTPGLVKADVSLIFPPGSSGSIKITDLEVVPVERYPTWDTLRETLQTRARQVRDMCGLDFRSFKCQDYKGPWWREKSEGSAIKDRKPENPTGLADERVMVDFTLRRTGPDEDQKGPSNRALQDYQLQLMALEQQNKKRLLMARQLQDGVPRGSQQDTEAEEETVKRRTVDDVAQETMQSLNITEEEFSWLYPAIVPAFGLTSKRWQWVLTDELRDVPWNKRAFEMLQLDPSIKGLIESLVKGHASNKVLFDDLIAGKGRGLVFLLHGKPGLGKTLTVESVAEYLQRPLYSISGGELGSNDTAVEKRLEEIFERTSRWNAVTLLDEADVLLCKRDSAEMDRNAIVAVFLRTLEYFQGVLFLTTNRKQDLDDAFKSRIHITISYPKLSPEARSLIWKNMIEQNKTLTVDDSWTEGVYTELGKLNLNGRTIKNILRTAAVYANAEEKPFGAWHVFVILRMEMRNGIEDKDGEDGSVNDDVPEALNQLERLIKSPSSVAPTASHETNDAED